MEEQINKPERFGLGEITDEAVNVLCIDKPLTKTDIELDSYNRLAVEDN